MGNGSAKYLINLTIICMSELGLNKRDAGSISPIPTQLWHLYWYMLSVIN